MPIEEKYYDNLEEVNKDYLNGTGNDSRIMFTFRKKGHTLRFTQYLHSIGLDAPSIMIKTKQGEIYTETYIKAAIGYYGLNCASYFGLIVPAITV
ncbi:hypothetical protein [Pedobacter sp. FW305-3-2-15-E-R2A2]|uniref:hypothetical protein n=1 Tax=Pedobacter sp. FW305-3-2-15-E-R2A2 TaxID=3140251 RepID=UPI00314095F9